MLLSHGSVETQTKDHRWSAPKYYRDVRVASGYRWGWSFGAYRGFGVA